MSEWAPPGVTHPAASGPFSGQGHGQHAGSAAENGYHERIQGDLLPLHGSDLVLKGRQPRLQGSQAVSARAAQRQRQELPGRRESDWEGAPRRPQRRP